MTSIEIREVLHELRDYYGETTVGYIGNLGPGMRDDRYWYVWFEDLPRGLATSYPNNKSSLPLGTTEQMSELTPTAFAFALGKRVSHFYSLLREGGYTPKDIHDLLHKKGAE